MKPLEKLTDSLYIAWTIARKDIVEAFTNKNTRINMVILLGLIVFFYWMSTPRPFDKRINAVVYDEDNSSINIKDAKLEDGTEFIFYEASSIDDMKRKMAYKELGLVLPVDLDQILEAGGEPTLEGYIFWVYRSKAAELEEKYSQKFTELLGQPVQVDIGDNIVIPYPDVETNSVPFHMIFALLWLSVSITPHLMLEERKTKTMEALLVSPASAWQVILGKAIAGLFYTALAGIVFFSFNGVYVFNWGFAFLAFCTIALFGTGLALAYGSAIESPQQLNLWTVVGLVIFIVPVIFVNEPFLASWLKSILVWVPTTGMAKLVQFSFSIGVPLDQLALNIGVAFVGIILVYAWLVWQIRRLGR
jgi:ABC-type transport system involved in multi-copper enzyme maturation permease subunit